MKVEIDLDELSQEQLEYLRDIYVITNSQLAHQIDLYIASNYSFNVPDISK